MGTCEVCKLMLELRAVGGFDLASVGGDVVGVEANTSFHHRWCPPGLEPVDSHRMGAQQPNGIAVLVDGARLSVIFALIRCSVLSAEGVRDEAMGLCLFGDELLSIEGHSRLVPRELGAGYIPAEDGNIGSHTSGARVLMVGLEGPREPFVLIHFALSMELRQLVEQPLAGILRSCITLGQVGTDSALFTRCRWQKVLNHELTKALPCQR